MQKFLYVNSSLSASPLVVKSPCNFPFLYTVMKYVLHPPLLGIKGTCLSPPAFYFLLFSIIPPFSMLHIISLTFYNTSSIPSSPMCVFHIPMNTKDIFHPRPNIFSFKPCDLNTDYPSPILSLQQY